MRSSTGRPTPGSTDEKVEELLSGFFQRHKRLLLILGAVLALLVIAGLIMTFT